MSKLKERTLHVSVTAQQVGVLSWWTQARANSPGIQNLTQRLIVSDRSSCPYANATYKAFCLLLGSHNACLVIPVVTILP